MSDGIDVDGAIEALSAELPDDYEAPVVQSESDEVLVGDNQPEAESFTGFDPNVLPEDLQTVYKSMQADYTRKTQEIAEIRRQMESFSESGVDPSEALEATQFLQRLQSDPYIAAEFANDINSRLEKMGIGQQAVQDDTPIDSGYEGLPPALAAELEEMRSFRAQMLEQQQHAEVMANLEEQEQLVRVSNPHFSDEDIDSIYSLAYSTDGDLNAAAEQYNAIQQRLLGKYMESKQVPLGAKPVPSGPNTVPASDFKSLDDAHKAAMEVVRNIS
jgi:hypothetical protein